MFYILDHTFGKFLFEVNNQATRTTSIDIVLFFLLLTLRMYFLTGNI